MGKEKGCESTRCCLSIFSVCLLLIIYVACGAIAFFFIETNQTEEEPISKPSQEDLDLDMLRNATVQRLWTLTVELNVFYESNWTQVAEVELQKFQDEIMNYIFHSDYYGTQRRLSSANCDDASFTSFPATILYCLTLITTIGYGTVSPRSLPGRILTVCYACVGIPLTLCYLAAVGDFFSKAIRRGYSKLWGKRRMNGVPVPLSLSLLFLYLIGGAVVFWWLEGWPFVDAIFFCFASLATIGFGGMLDPHSKSISLIVSSVYILLGMALISTVFNLVQDEILRKRAGRYHSPIS